MIAALLKAAATALVEALLERLNAAPKPGPYVPPLPPKHQR